MSFMKIIESCVDANTSRNVDSIGPRPSMVAFSCFFAICLMKRSMFFNWFKRVPNETVRTFGFRYSCGNKEINEKTQLLREASIHLALEIPKTLKRKYIEKHRLKWPCGKYTGGHFGSCRRPLGSILELSGVLEATCSSLFSISILNQFVN